MGDGNWKCYRSKKDQIQSIFVTNFPHHVMAHDLWKVCNDYGVVVDAFIPYKKSKAGKRFAFVRFIKEYNIDCLIANLCTTWIGRFHLYANVARFIENINLLLLPTPLMLMRGIHQVLLSLFLNWEKGITSCLISESSNDEEDVEDDESQSGDKVTTDNDVERVSESSCMNNNDLLYDNNLNNIMPDKDKVLSEDPFNLYDILNTRKDSGDDLKYPPRFTSIVINVDDVKGATSNEVNKHVHSTSNKLEEYVPKGKLSSNNSVCLKRVHTSGLILQLMDELVKVGQTMAYNMEGCMTNIEAIISSQGEYNVVK
ncbi:RNA-directed DNA polymerase, eukaryota [Tanacetum coccineum]